MTDLRKKKFGDVYIDPAKRTGLTSYRGAELYRCPFFRNTQPEVENTNMKYCPYGKSERFCDKCATYNSYKEGWNPARRAYMDDYMKRWGKMPFRIGNQVVESDSGNKV